MEKLKLSNLYKRNKRYIVLISLLSLLYSFFLSYPLSILRDYIDSAANSINNFNRLIILVVIYLLCLIISYSILNFQKYLTYKIQNKLSHELRLKAYDHLTTLYQDFFDNSELTEIVNKVIQDSDIVIQGFLSPIVNVSKAVFSFSFGFYFMWIINRYLALIILLFSIIFGLVTKLSSRKFKKLAAENRKKNSVMWKVLQENLRGIRDIHALCQEKQQRSQVENASLQMQNNYTNTAKFAFKMNMINNFAFILLISSLVIGGSILIKNNLVSIGAIAAIITYNNLLASPIQDIVAMFQDIFKVKVSISRLNELFNTQSDNSYSYGFDNQIKIEQKDALIFKNVSFAYSGKEPILKNINFVIEPRKKYAFVGKTGCGKSTILKLCSGIYDRMQGEIYLFGNKLEEKNKCLLRKQMGFIFQDTFLFNGTIYDNITFANKNATLDEVQKVVQIACVDEIISKKNFGINTTIGENGVQLSGGERQRIGIARTLLKKPKILFLDEATSSLDNETERKIMENIFREFKNLTIVIIAHRLSTIVNVDKIFYLENGSIIEEGDHETLLRLSSNYKNLYYANLKLNGNK